MKQFKDFIKELRKTPRGRALFKLGLWIIFFAFCGLLLLLMSIFAEKKQPVESNKQETSVIASLNNLANTNYSYNFEVNNENGKVVYHGDKYLDIYYGYRENNENIIKYQLEGEYAYQIIGDYSEPIDTVYQNVNAQYFTIGNIINMIVDKTYEKTDNNYVYHMEGITITIQITNNYINSILIEDNGSTYHFTYSNYNNVNEIKRIAN